LPRSSSPRSGLSISFTVQAPAVLTSASTLPTAADGHATAYVFLPYSSQSVVVASGGNSLANAIQISNAPILLTPGPTPSSDAGTSTGQFWFLTANASANMGPVPGLTLTFTPLPTGTPATSTAVTDLNGNAMASVFAPWGPSELVMIAGGGSTTWATIPKAANPSSVVTLQQPSCAPIGGANGATVYSITTTAQIGTASKPGILVSFSVIYPTGTGAPIAVPATATTDVNGNATTVVAIPSGSATEVEVSEGSWVWNCDLPSCNCVNAQDGG
jgi:hypothetical protein